MYGSSASFEYGKGGTVKATGFSSGFLEFAGLIL
jgi:hypothetical protein